MACARVLTQRLCANALPVCFVGLEWNGEVAAEATRSFPAICGGRWVMFDVPAGWLAPFSERCQPSVVQAEAPTSGATVGVLSKMTVPRSRAGVRCRSANVRRCCTHHHALAADAIAPTRIPNV